MSRIARRGVCEVCRRRVAPRFMTVVHDDLGDHDLCNRCEETYSVNVMRYFARELHQHAIMLATRVR